MTEDYKDTLLRYFTGNLNKQDIYYNIPQFQETKVSTSTIYSYIYDNAGSDFTILGLLQGYNSTYSIVYGNTSSNKGFIVILDESNTPVQYIDSYNTGTEFGEFQILNIEEDGNLYGIDINNSTPRFIMLNNITLVLPNQSNFVVKLRQSYNLPSPLSTASSYFAITKAVGQGKYLIGATTTSGSIDSPLVTELTINVGSTNDWINYQTSVTNSFTGRSIWASWDNDVIDFKINGFSTGTTSSYYTEFVEGSSNTLTPTNVELSMIQGYSEGYYEINTLLVSKNLAYIGIYDGGEYGTDELNLIYQYNGSLDLIGTFQKSVTLPYTGIDRKVNLKVINGNVYFMCKCYEMYSGVNDLYIYYGIILPGDIPQLYSTNVLIDDGTTWRYDFLVSNIYNLYTYHILSFDFEDNTSKGSNYSTKQIYNSSNYNGEAYENINSLVAHTGELYDTNDSLIFARNLYNNTITNNITLSVLQIPNTILNDISISQQVLLGSTNKILTTNEEQLVKNIYETVYYNFYNTMMIEDRNTPIYSQNMNGAIRINQSTSLVTDYDNAKATKYRLNYSDDTSLALPTTPTMKYQQNITGNNLLYITDAESDNAINYTTDGVCQQESTPTPDSPIDIETIPSIINLFNQKGEVTTTAQPVYYNNGFTFTKNVNRAVRISLPQPLEPGTYVFSWKLIDSNLTNINKFGVTFQTSSNTNVGTSYFNNNGYATFTANSAFERLYLFINNDQSDDATITFDDFQLEKSSMPHDFKPYGYYSRINICGKNLLPNNAITTTINGITYTINDDKSITVSGTATADAYLPLNGGKLFRMEAGDYTRTLSEDGTDITGITIQTRKDTVGGTDVFGGAYSRLKTTTLTEPAYVVARIRVANGTAISTPITLYPMIVDGTYTTSNMPTYEAYKENTTLIDMGIYENGNLTGYYELCKIGDYKDTLSIDNNGNCVINKNIEKIVFNGSESWTRNSSTGYERYYSAKITDALSVATRTNCMSNYFNFQASGNSVGTCFLSNGRAYLYPNTTITTASDFQTWLSTHNTEVYYPLATTETINLANTTIQLFEGINHITFVDTLTTNTNLTYSITPIATYNIDVYVPNDRTISTLEIISNDENTIYQTIDTSSLENNKFYNITQDCYVE